MLLVSQESLDDLNGRLETPVPMERFRANVVVEGLGAFGEDEVGSLSTGSVRLERATVCERCIVVSTDQQTGARAQEPLRTLSQYRKREGGYAGGIMFGAYMAVAGEGRLQRGDGFDASSSEPSNPS